MLTGALNSTRSTPPSTQTASTMSEKMQLVRLGLAGTGFIGRIHWMCYRALPGIYAEPPARVMFDTVYTSHPSEADRVEFSRALPYDSVSSTCAQIDMLDVCTPNAAHRSLVEAAVAAHVRVYCEKPVSYTHLRAHETVLDLVCRLL